MARGKKKKRKKSGGTGNSGGSTAAAKRGSDGKFLVGGAFPNLNSSRTKRFARARRRGGRGGGKIKGEPLPQSFMSWS